MNAAPAIRQDDQPLIALRAQLEQRAAEFRMVLPEHISPEKFQRTLITAVQTNPDLLACDRRSFLTACMKAAQDGLLPDGREAAIVPFKTRVKTPDGWVEVRLAQYMPMVFGLRKKILQSGEVADLFATVVYRQEIERGCFVYEEGSERCLRHKPILDADFAPTDADIALAYSVATFRDGTKSFEVMRRGDLDRVREASQTGAAFDAKGQPRDPKGPWREWFPEMAKKTVIRRHSKSLPQSGDIIVRDVESEDMGLAAARSTLALLDSRQSEPPRQIEPPAMISPDLGPPTFPDPTAEPDDAPEYVEPPAASFDPEPVDQGFDPATEKLRRMVEGEPEPDDDFEPEPEPEATDEEIDAAPKDELGVTKDDQERLAEAYIARAKACELLVDFQALRREAELDLAAMRPEIAACVDTEFDKARKRLTPPAKDKAS